MAQSADQHAGEAVTTIAAATEDLPPPRLTLPLSYSTEAFSCAVRLGSNVLAGGGEFIDDCQR